MKKSIWCVMAIAFTASILATGCAGLFTQGNRWEGEAEPETGPAETSELEVVNKEEERREATKEKSKGKAQEKIKKAHVKKVRDFINDADKLRMAALSSRKAIRLEVLVETEEEEEGPAVQTCGLMGMRYSRGGEMEFCKPHHLYEFSRRVGKIAEAKKYYNQALDMDPNSVQALVGLANLYIIQAVDAQYVRDKLRLELVEQLVPLEPKGKASDDILDMSFTELIAKIRPKNSPTKGEKKSIRRQLWDATRNQHDIDSYLRAARARCEDALRVNAQFAPAHLGLAVVAAIQQKWKVAIAKLTFLEENKLEIRRNRSMFYVWKGFVLERMGNLDDALKAYGTAIELDEPYDFMDYPRKRVRAILLSQKPR
ncbi:MAG: tetratricopeptide repeat protein [Deltaproteobacteria bacterium]|nr:tetratricopeptide repeat protein [Deltaproteobacteria bacterium]MBW1871261.1 tetratricopeptide repeat protein [Deltaproteobacteria bacterium]